MKQWRVLCPDGKLQKELEQHALEIGFNGIVVDQLSESTLLTPLLKLVPPKISPFDPAFEKFLEQVPIGVSLYWESALFSMDIKKELLKRALLPFEMHLHEITLLKRVVRPGALFYVLPEDCVPKERHLQQWAKEESVYIVYSHVKGDPKRLDFPPSPISELGMPSLVPLWDAAPLGEWPFPFRVSPQGQFVLKTPHQWIPGSALEKQLLLFTRVGQEKGPFLDSKLCYVRAVAEGKETANQEEFRLLCEALIAEMRWEEKKGSTAGHEQKKALIIQAMEASRLPVPYHLKLAHHA